MYVYRSKKITLHVAQGLYFAVNGSYHTYE